MPISRRELFSLFRRPDKAPDGPPPVAEPPAATPAPSGAAPSPKAAPRTPAKLYLRPPGALAEADFLAACHRCGRCVEVCPRSALGPVVDEGLAKGTPFLVARQAPCVVCTGLQCTHVCPSGALTPLDDPTRITMGTATVALDRCLATRGTACTDCFDHCPIPGALTRTDGPRGQAVPRVDPARCVGCGLCENFCPPEPAAIRVVPRR